ncbi:hypothetical protein QBC42DRAFT_190311 [Cladorrhinum samala]|uniref:Uncharacterized protein n=1 Tax=Cladorrhinum samala TaxID=585594 RepID=A0AAV9H858_9PEZI|nr:hypothetical protein QBC42DRAFT_190311 [Cladorrhinum samala]
MRTTGFDAEVWVERPDGTTIEWERFVSGGGCNLPDKTPYLHIECWVFKVGPFREYKLKESGESVCGIPTSSNHQDAPKQVRTFTPDSFHDASSNLFKSEFTAISFEPPKTARYALVTDTIGSALERIGLLELLLSHEVAQDNTEPQTTEDKLSEHDDDFPQAHRCRIRLG